MINAEHFLLIGAILLFVAVMAGKVAYRFNAPALLLFLAVGLFFGYDILSFNSPELTQFIGMISLCIILFSGGMDTKISEIRPVVAEGITLATAGVLMTALLLGSFVYFVAPWIGIELTFPLALLLASTISSTDSASVFSILRTRRQGLTENLRPLLELESGSNDPMAYILVILLVKMLGGDGNEEVGIGGAILMFVVQMAVGAFIGYLFGRLSVWIINKIDINNASLYSVLLLACVFFTFSFTSIIKGNGYLAVYIAGLIVGNNKLVNKRTVTTFFDGITWLFQIIMFLMLGLLPDACCAPYSHFRLPRSIPQVIDQSSPLHLVGGLAWRRTHHLCDISVGGKRRGGRDCIQRRIHYDHPFAGGAGHNGQQYGRASTLGFHREGE